MGKELPGIHQLIEASINKIDMDVRWVLRGNIILVGGTTTIPGFVDRLQKELTNLLPIQNKVRVVAAPERKYSSWIGGSILASLTPPEKWFSKEEYDEYGPSYSRKKHLCLLIASLPWSA
jgi:actin